MISRSSRFFMPRGPARLTFARARHGFTLPEILIVIVMISLLALVAIPRFANMNGKRHMESARMRVAAALATARAAAIQKGVPVRFQLKENRVTVYRVPPVSASDTLNRFPLDTLYKVTVASPTSTLQIDFSARGFANLNGPKVIRLSRPGVPNDSVRVAITGMVMR